MDGWGEIGGEKKSSGVGGGGGRRVTDFENSVSIQSKRSLVCRLAQK